MKIVFALVCIVLNCTAVYAQFDVTKYKEYVQSRKTLTPDQLRKEYDAGYFIGNTNTDYSKAEYFADIQKKMELTSGERELIAKHGFMVTSRISYPSFNAGFYDIYNKDLPVYISADAVLHALHRSYDNMLKYVEKEILAKELKMALEKIHNYIDIDKNRKSLTPFELRSLQDADIYISVTQHLLDPNAGIKPVFFENNTAIADLLKLVHTQSPAQYNLFSSQPRDIDFSQMKPRGHYTQDPELTAYFQAMMWLGRTELYITAPKTNGVTPTEEDIKRQCALSIKIAECAQNSTALLNLNNIDKAITLFVGAQDNLTTNDLLKVLSVHNINVNSIQQKETLQKFQKECVEAGAAQKILSQILFGDGGTEQITPAAAYMLMGQRFIIDSYVFMNVVYDKVAGRLMPSTLDAMFALGNNSALHLLDNELKRFEYAPQLAGLRYLLDSYGKNDWNSSLYASWLQSLRTLNPPSQEKRNDLPKFMQTAAWWQKTLNTQLMSWAELRHDNLLYAKQSYTGGVGCFYPEGYVEPVPELYATVKSFANQFKTALKSLSAQGNIDRLLQTLDKYETVMTALESIAHKELNHEELNDSEMSIIKNWVMQKDVNVVCAIEKHYTGCYQSLMFDVESNIQSDHNPNFIIADVHTQPTDEVGNMVGKVLHVGTGAPSLAVIIATDKDGCSTAYSGPVGSYFEHISENFQRLTDEEWADTYLSKGLRPNFTNLYMANNEGAAYNNSPTLLISSVDDSDFQESEGLSYPNPFSVNTMITFNVPDSKSNSAAVVRIYSSAGELIKEVYNNRTIAGNHSVRWDGTNDKGEAVANGAYTYIITIDKEQFTGTMVLQRKQ